ncbi:SDR family NAD(P)-dependent oxidoreductase [Gorillibacterium massiliense]|uniref:SDR family NAD(P)-dependent oxidoreductase n=1 Tax=Gorillibacterium massiliense TaxID=1280390 RepID=UPI0004AD2333|nr:SDR family oxidoreductase [Gorillibacterium massiliense]
MEKTAFVTGGSRGIGRGIAQLLGQKGYDIAFTYNSKLEEAESLQRELREMGRRCFFYQASLEREEVAEQVTDQAIADLGRLDVMICCAGLTAHNNLRKLTAEDIDFVYRLDYRSYMLCAKKAATHMIESGIAGNIVFITSTRGEQAYPEDPLYGGMKAALNRACESLALELAEYGIRVNCVAPGATAVRGSFTPEELRGNPFARQIPLGRLGTPAEVAGLTAYLVSEEAAYITGTVMRMDGGLILPGIPMDAEAEAPSWFRLPDHYL